MKNEAWTTELLIELRKLGDSVAIDDFGIGYSSLGRLNDFPVNRLKIDRSFVQGVDHAGRHATLVAAILSMAKGSVSMSSRKASRISTAAAPAGPALQRGAGLPAQQATAGRPGHRVARAARAQRRHPHDAAAQPGPGSAHRIRVRPAMLKARGPRAVDGIDGRAHRGVRRAGARRPARDGKPPFLLLHGSDDDLARPRNSVSLAKRLQAAHEPCELWIYPGIGHIRILAAMDLSYGRRNHPRRRQGVRRALTTDGFP